ncbi:MAG: GGDEF domain-containing protein [Methylophilaceae bacterium]|nr:GGDEF domain-containing protein [Methylophilaceae bacterium]
MDDFTTTVARNPDVHPDKFDHPTDRTRGDSMRVASPQAGIDLSESAHAHLCDIVQNRQLSALFQPIIDLHEAKIIGFEGLIRGPVSSPLHSPLSLFEAARSCGMITEVEYLSRWIVLASFARLKLSGKVFLNISPDVLQHGAKSGETLQYIKELGLHPHQVIIEITESTPTLDYPLMRDATRHYRGMGFEIAIDDLGEGFSGLRLWSELRPNYVKIDKHFIQGMNRDAVKLQFVRSIQEIANKASARIIAEGIETHDDLMVVRDLGIAYGQGYYIARPDAEPVQELSPELVQSLKRNELPRAGLLQQRTTVEKLLRIVPTVTPSACNEEVFQLFENDSNLYSVPVVLEGRPVGLISRYTMIDGFARPFRRELYGRRQCVMMMDPHPLIVEKTTNLRELSEIILQNEPHHLAAGFIIVENGRYVGIGSGHDLLRLVTQMQIDAARYANPLTLLPGNVPIYEQIDSLLQTETPFVACYCDLDHFKAYNDVYGYKKGDEVIQETARHLQQLCGPYDFLGHIGGDDFIVLFQSEHWEGRCRALLSSLGEVFRKFYNDADRQRGGIETEDRQGERRFHPIISLSMGAVLIQPRQFHTHHEVASAATLAKKEAKKTPGNSLFIERRGYHGPIK